LALALTACGTSSSAADWKAPQDILASLDQAGIPCEGSGDGRVREGADQPGFVSANCGSFEVVLITDVTKFESFQTSQCPQIDDAFWAAAAKAPLVTGPNFLVFGTALDGSFPADAQPAAFVRAFGGVEAPTSDRYQRLCGVSPDVVASAAATDATDGGAKMDADLRSAAAAMNAYFAEKGVYPTSLDELTGFAPTDANKVTIEWSDSSGYCLEVSNLDLTPVRGHYDSRTGEVDVASCPAQ
jgi:hypothetical protein